MTAMAQRTELMNELRDWVRDIPPTPLPFGRTRAAGLPLMASHVSRQLDAAWLARAGQLWAARGIALEVVVECIWAVVLARSSGQGEVAFFVDVPGRRLPVGNRLDATAAFDVWAQDYAAARYRVRHHFEQTAPDSMTGGLDSSHVESGVVVAASLSGVSAELTALPLWIGIELQTSRLQVAGDAARFEPGAFDNLAAQVELGLRRVTEAPKLACKDLILLTSDDHAAAMSFAPRDSTGRSIPALFHEQVAQRPDAAAVRGAAVLTYGELATRSDALAQQLVALGVVREDRVALCLTRSPELIVVLLAILKAGAAYLPIEPSYPRARIALLLEDANPRVLVTEGSLRALLPAVLPCPMLDVHTLPPQPKAAQALPEPAAEDPAYVLYTSGSTGTPKGVVVPHRAVERLVKHATFARLDATVTMLQAAPVAFDASTFEIWGALLNGGCLVLHDEIVPTARGLAQVIAEHRVSTLWLTAALFNAVVDADVSALAGLSQLLTGGEALSVPHVRRALDALPHTQIINGYGPTETTTFATCHPIARPLPGSLTAIPIGSAIRDTYLRVCDDEGRPLPRGWVGELYIGGRGVALGYLGRPELTAERFIPDAAGDARIYRTGDLVRHRLDGVLEYLGRVDQQVKIRGFRVEPGEVEHALLQLAEVQSAAVTVRSRASGEKQLVAYVVPANADHKPAASVLRSALASALPAYLVPASFVWLERLPTTANGKLDVQALPAPGRERPELSTEFVSPRSALEQQLARAWEDALELEAIGVHDNLFDLGASSLLVVRTVAEIAHRHGYQIPAQRVFESPSIAALALYVAQGAQPMAAAPVSSRGRASDLADSVAIIGMAGRFPGASTVEQFWQNLCAGTESITFFDASELAATLDPALVRDPAYVKARGVLHDVAMFDAAFFGIKPKEAQLMDPQQRVLLEVAWEALEDAGYDPARHAGPIGVFAGKYNNSYYANNVLGRPELVAELGDFQTMVANEKDYVASHVAHRLGLRGPAVSIHTACSTSLVAVVQAVQNLLLGQCEMALAGGVSITVPVQSGYLYQEGAMFSPDGHTRPFDARAQGTVFSDGAAMVLLKPLRAAVADGDHVYAVIRGAATNNDGQGRASFSAPSSAGQAAVVALAQQQAGVSARDISYVEAHGTATPLGDPIELDALTRAFRAHTSDRGFCALGSVKSNVGHLVIAAGVAGLIKTALSLSTRTLVPTLHFTQPNPKIDFADSPFLVNRALRPWPDTGKPRLAGVSSFGVGGSNAHVILEEPPPVPADTRGARAAELLLLSARSQAALTRAGLQLADWLEKHPETALADVAHTLKVGRAELAYRRYVAASTPREACAALRAETSLMKVSGRPLRVAFMFPGQGAQYPGMGASLYRDHALFREHVDSAAERLRGELGYDLRTVLFAEPAATSETIRLDQTAFTQPALFVVSYALAELWRSFGVAPSAMLGHSVGELVCAVLAGVMRFEDALSVVAARGRIMQDLPSGAMLSVRMPAHEVVSLLDKFALRRATIACVNAPVQCVVAGEHAEIERLQRILVEQGAAFRPLRTSHAFHSAMMDPVVPLLRARLADVQLSAPAIPFVSTVTGTWITAEQAQDPAYWAQQARLPVQFASAVKVLIDSEDTVLLEVGPRSTLATLTRQQLRDRSTQVCVSSMGDVERDAAASLLSAAGRLWTLGVPLADSVVADAPRTARRRVSLPSYPFERLRFWVEPGVNVAHAAKPQPSATAVLEAASGGITQAEPEVVEVHTPSSHVQLIAALRALLEETSGLELTEADSDVSFVELGLDSLFLTQFSLALGNKLKYAISFRQLLEDLPTLGAVAAHIARSAPPTAASPARADEAAVRSEPTHDISKYDVKQAFGAIARITVSPADALTPRQRAKLDALVRRYNDKTRGSKRFTQENRRVIADPRVVTGFRPLTKELVYPLVVDHSQGSKLWDIDGNEYVDALNGFGMSLFGWQPEFVTEALSQQLRRGYEIGPQHPLQADVAKLICELTGFDRAAFCNTGSEAVMGCTRIARTVTGRNKIAIFSGSYHGIFDEVVVRGTKQLRSIPAAPGIMPATSANVLVLDYGTDESLKVLHTHAAELAAIIVEPIQSRRPDFQPHAFVRALRELTRQHGVALVFDEVVTGFRTGLGGAQAFYDVKADLAAYGKVVGGGLPIGVIAGDTRFMDALDGGHWEFGDGSLPPSGVTYFAGTFVRHPLALAAANAVLTHLKKAGPRLQQTLNEKTAAFASDLNQFVERVGAPISVKHFASLWKAVFTADQPYGDMLFFMMRDRGVHIYDGFPCFFTTAHSDEDFARIATAFKDSVLEMQDAGFLPQRRAPSTAATLDASAPPVPGARLGRDPNGNPAWYVPHPTEPHRYVKHEVR
jgi:amino acid adenylation domain-containing protein